MGKHRGSRFTRRRRVVVLFVSVALVVLAAASAAAAYVYEERMADRILPGVRIAEVDVGGLTRAQATEAVREATQALLSRELTVSVGRRQWAEPVASLGVRAEIGRAVDRAFALSESRPWVSRAYHRLSDRPLGESIELSYRYRPGPVRALLKAIAAEVYRPSTDAAIMLRDGMIELQRPRTGRDLDVTAGVGLAAAALGSWQTEVSLPLERVAPEVTEEDLGKTITVDLTSNTLRLYDGLGVIKRYDVGTAMRGFSTPSGVWEVIDKRENPAWYNPAPDGWGAEMPLVIPGGPDNPLGTRALYLDAPGIRIHGTPSTTSVGFYVSHGCIRMRMWEVEELYPLVPIGTPVLVYGAPPWGIVEDPGIAGT
ncbi:MAG: L,D-transpeptidase family protein [Actinomycetota bacterium]